MTHILTVKGTGKSDVGRRRKTNEDAFFSDDELGLWIVADGMGGHAAGEVASHEAIDTIVGMVRRRRDEVVESVRHGGDELRLVGRMLESAVQAATYLVFAMGEMDKEKAGMGTTISALYRVGDLALTAQVGDSRVYRIRQGEVVQLTEDHTLINWQLKKGIITDEEARRSRHKNVITRAVGNRDYVQVDIGTVDLTSGDRYLLCSDGLHGYLKIDEVAELAAPGGEEAVQSFIDLANSRGGKDNITALLVEVD